MEGLRKRHSSKPSSTSPPVVVAAPSGVPTGNSAARNASGGSISSSNFFLVTQKIFLMLFLLLFAFLISIAVVMGIGFLVFPAYTPAINGSNSISLLTEIEIGGNFLPKQNKNNKIECALSAHACNSRRKSVSAVQRTECKQSYSSFSAWRARFTFLLHLCIIIIIKGHSCVHNLGSND